MNDTRDSSSATSSHSRPLSASSSHHHRGQMSSSNDFPAVPRILASSSRMSQAHEAPVARSESSTSSDPLNTVASSSSTPEDDPEAADPAIIDALKNAKERLFVLKLGESMETLILERRDVPLQLSPATSYQRMLVHRCSSYYRLHPETDGPNKTILVSITAESRIPPVRMVDVVPSDNSTSPAFKIMRRSAGEKPNRKGRSGSADADSDGSDGGSGQKKRRNMTIAEREAAYNEARSRIFSSFEERDEANSANSSSHSLSSPTSMSDSITTATNVDDETRSEGATRSSSSKNGTKRAAGKDRWSDTSRSTSTNFDPEFDRSSFTYPSIYEAPTTGFEQPYVMPSQHPAHPDEQGFVPPHFAMYPPYPYPPPYMSTYPYYYDPRHYGYPPPPPPHPPQANDGSSQGPPPNAPPYVMYPHGGPAWYPPPPPPPPRSSGAIAPAPVQHQNHPPPPMPRAPQGQQQQQQQQQQQSQQAPPQPTPTYFNPIAPPFYPPQFQMANYDPSSSQQQQQHQPQQQQQQQLPPQNPQQQHQQQHPHMGPPSRSASGALYTPPQEDSSRPIMGPPTSRFSSSSRGSSRSNVRDAAGTSAGRMRANANGPSTSTSTSSPGPRNPPQLPRNPWSYGPGLGIPMASAAAAGGGRRSGSSSSRAGSVSSRSGSNGAMTPADETGSIASSETSSSSSRKTFTSNSSRHPLPARPDWAIGLPRGSSSNHSRRSSGSSSALQSVSSDFPVLPPPGDRTVSAPILSSLPSGEPAITNGVWKAPAPPLSTGVTRPHSSRNGSQSSDGPRRSHSHPTSGGVTLGVSPSPTSSLPPTTTTFPSSSPSRVPSTSTLPPPAPSLPAPPHRVYQHQQQHQQAQPPTRLSENDAAFKRPAPKAAAALFDPTKPLQKSPSASPHSGSPVGATSNTGGGGYVGHASSPVSGSPAAKTPEEEQSDRLRGEAIANAILIDKIASLQISATSSSSSSSAAANSSSGPSPNVAEESLARRGTITQNAASSGGAGVLLLSASSDTAA